MADVSALLARGALLPAADALCAEGRHGEAADLYARLSLPGREARCARHAGDLLRAHRAHLVARDFEAAADDRRQALAAGPDRRALRRRLAGDCAAAGRDAEAAGLLELAGDLAGAADAYARAGDRPAAARLLTFLGRPREAAEVLSAHLAGITGVAPQAEVDAAAVALARVELRLGRAEDAARLAQAVARRGGPRGQAAQVIRLQAFAALGYPAACEAVWAELAPTLSDPPADHRTFLARLAQDLEETGEETAAGRTIAGRYRLERLLGAGGAGQVYLATEIASGRKVALKLLARSPATGDAVDRFFREARIARALSHPGLVRILDADPARGYLAMAFLPGGTLADRLGGGRRLPFAEVQALGVDVAGALGVAHRRGILHRDVKPENVLFDGAGRAHLCDFGAAHLLSFQQTVTGALLGTMAYMSPEQLAGGALGGPSDLFGLAATLYRAAVGALPFPGLEIAEAQARGAPPPSAQVPGLGPEVDAFFARALAPDPAARFPDAEAFATALAAVPQVPEGAPAGASGAAAAVPTGARGPGGADPGPGAPVSAPSGRWSVVRPLGARVALARDTVLPRHVVLERIPGADPEAYRARLGALARAGNPQLQALLDLDPEGDLVVWAFVEGRPLAEVLGARPPRPLALRLAADVARALVDHPGPLRPGRARVVDRRVVVLVAGADALRGATPPPADARPDVGRILAWADTGVDPGPAAAPLEALGAGVPAPPGAAALADWLEARSPLRPPGDPSPGEAISGPAAGR